MHTRELTQSALLPCEGRCRRPTRHYFFRTLPRAGAMSSLMYRCQDCEHERVWGTVESAVLVPRAN